MSIEKKSAAAAAASPVADSRSCSCLPFCLWGSPVSEFGLGVASDRKRRKYRLKLSWFSWSWFRKNKKKKAKKKKRRRLFFTSFCNTKKTFSSVSISLFPKVRSFGDTKKQNTSKPRSEVDTTRSTGPQRPKTSTDTTGSTTRLGAAQPELKSTDKASNIRRTPSKKCHLVQPDRSEPVAGLWTMATTLGVIVFFGRVGAVIFLCSCLYGTRFVRSHPTTVKRTGGCSDRMAEKVVEMYTEEYKKEVIMEGLLWRAGKRPPSRFCHKLL